MCIYVYMYICIYVYMYVCMYVCMYVHMYILIAWLVLWLRCQMSNKSKCRACDEAIPKDTLRVVRSRFKMRSHFETLIACKLSSRKFSTHNDLC